MTKMAGRPHSKLNWDVLNAILQYGATLPDCSEMLGVSEDTIQRAVKKEHRLTFSEYRNKKMGRVRIKLLQKQIEVAMSGSVPLLIWLGKQYLGQLDKQEVVQSGGQTIKIEKIEEDL